MKIILFLIVFLLAGVAHGQSVKEVLVVGKTGFPPHEVVRRTFEREFSGFVLVTGGKAIKSGLHFHEVPVGRGDSAQTVAAKVRSYQPDLILALGAEALAVADHFSSVPVISLLVINPEKKINSHTNIIGIDLAIPAKVQLDEATRFLPQVKRVGVIFDPVRSGAIVAEARAVRPDLEFVALAADSAREVQDLLKQLRGRIDLLWMLPDLTVTNTKTIDSYLRFSFEYKVPLLVFSEKYLKLGAAIAVTFDIEAMAVEAARIGAGILTRADSADLRPRITAGRKTVINENILHKMKIPFVGKNQ